MAVALFPLPQLVVDGLVLSYPDPRHLFEHALPPEPLEAVDLELRVPDVLEALWRLVDFLDSFKNKRQEIFAQHKGSVKAQGWTFGVCGSAV